LHFGQARISNKSLLMVMRFLLDYALQINPQALRINSGMA
jgi:hypothetical protein